MTDSNDPVTRLVTHAGAISDRGLGDAGVQQLREIASNDPALLDDAMAAVWAGGGTLEDRRRRVELLARARYENER